jgi:hypothetical protein
MMDLSVDWNVTPQTSLTFYVAGVREGGVAERIYPDGREASYLLIHPTFSGLLPGPHSFHLSQRLLRARRTPITAPNPNTP